MNVRVRRFDPQTPGEDAILYGIFFEAARIGAKHNYTEAQRRVWAPHRHMPDKWQDKLEQLEIWVGEADTEIAGFMATTCDGYIDLAFVRPRWMGRGVAQALYERVLERANARNQSRLTTHASLLARQFFARRGWQVDYPEQIAKDGEVLKRFAMSLELGGPNDHTHQS